MSKENFPIEIRDITRLEDFQKCVFIQKEVWGFDDPYDIVPLPLLIVSQKNAGIVLGAFLNGEELIGFVYSLPGEREGHKLQWSHMLAVQLPYRNSEIGYRLKMAQYERTKELGCYAVEWTFDPLESRNAHFNLNKLNCVAFEYEVNIYGETSSPLHQGSPTDRLIAHWRIPLIQKNVPAWTAIPEPPALITRTTQEAGLLRITGLDLEASGEMLFLEIPPNMQTLKSISAEEGTRWRLQTRDAFTHYLHHGYFVFSFLRIQGRSFYVLKKT